jgi:hypothetical protein
LPFGKGRWLFNDAPSVVNALVGNWSMSSVVRLQGGQPYVPIITDTNRLGGTNRAIRLDIVPGVPLKNPRYSGSCSIGNLCEPYINPAAFIRPAKGSLGNAPRTLDVRSPMQEYFDFSLQKSFGLPFSKDSNRKVQFRVDLINAFNHPNFRYTNTGNTPPAFGGLPNEALLVQNDLNAWLAANPGKTATLAQVNALIINSRLPPAPGQTTGPLPLDFFHVPIPEGFATTNANAFDITTLEGLKRYRLRQAYDTSFGALNSAFSQPRYIQFGVKIFF